MSNLDSLPLMANNATKAGMEGLNKDKINEIIYNASKGSKFFTAKQQKQSKIEEQKNDIMKKWSDLDSTAIANADVLADQFIFREGGHDLSRIIVHIDMDMFYAAVEMKDNPELKEKPMAVGSTGMISTSNYLARKFGVRSGLAGFIGLKLCPQLVLVAPNFDKYKAISRVIHTIFETYDPDFQPMSLDEAFLDLTSYMSNLNEYQSVEDVVEKMRNEIFEKTELTASAGIACNTMLAKICSDMNKPNGQYYLKPNLNCITDFMDSLPIRKVNGIGNVTEQLLSALNIKTCKDLYMRRGCIYLLFGESTSQFLLRVSRGIGANRLSHSSDRIQKSISAETTFSNCRDLSKLNEILAEQCQDVTSQLVESSRSCRNVGIKLKTDTFVNRSRAMTLSVTTNELSVIEKTAKQCLLYLFNNSLSKDEKLMVRLLGVRVSDLSSTEDTPKPSSHSSLKSFFETTKSTCSYTKIKIKCPVCCETFEVKNETEFNKSHFEFCISKDADTPESQGHEVGDSSLQMRENSGSRSADDTKVTCPICDCKCEERYMNSHIDQCLNQDFIKTFMNQQQKLENEDSSKNNRKRKQDDLRVKKIDNYFIRKDAKVVKKL